MTARERIAAALGIHDSRSLLMSVRISAWIVVISIAARLISLPAIFRLSETRRRLGSFGTPSGGGDCATD